MNAASTCQGDGVMQIWDNANYILSTAAAVFLGLAAWTIVLSLFRHIKAGKHGIVKEAVILIVVAAVVGALLLIQELVTPK